MVDPNATYTRMEDSSSQLQSSDLDFEQTAQDAPYHQDTGDLMELIIDTRADIGCADCKLSQTCEKQTKSHWSSVNRLIWYLKSIRNIGIAFRVLLLRLVWVQWD